MTSLFVDRRAAELELEGGAIVFRHDGERIGTVPLAPLTRVFLRGDVRLSAAVLGTLGERGIGVVVLSGRYGKPTLMLPQPHNDAARRVAQIRLSLDHGFCLALSRALVVRKLACQIVWLSELRDAEPEARYALTRALATLEEHSGRIGGQDSTDALRGLEGAAAAAYFAGFRAVVPESLAFNTRNRRPPKDPFNAVLSLTYVLLYAELVIALHGEGFDPYVGFYHKRAFGRASLALDLLDPLRACVDRFALRVFRERTLRVEDFSAGEDGCRLGKAGRARYYAAYEGERALLRKAAQAEVRWLVEWLGPHFCSERSLSDHPNFQGK